MTHRASMNLLRVGYSIGLVLDAARRHQASSAHPDVIHLSSQFLRAATPGLMQIRISELKIGNRFTNLAAELHQKVGTRRKPRLAPVKQSGSTYLLRTY